MDSLGQPTELCPIPPDRTPLGRTRALANGAINTVRLSRALVNARRRVELAGLDAVIGLLCAKALDLPPDQGRALLPELCGLLEEIEMVTEAIRAATGS